MDSKRLVKGKIYFTCGYAHKKYPIPSIKVLVYVGEKVLGSGVRGFLFQTPEKYYRDEVHELNFSEDATNKDESKGYSILYPVEHMNLVYDIDGLQSFVNDLRNRPHGKQMF